MAETAKVIVRPEGLPALEADRPTVPENCALVVVGASGDLTRRKLIPALYQLAKVGALPEGFAVVGVARQEMSDDGFRREMHQAVEQFAREPLEEAAWERFAPSLFSVCSDASTRDGIATLADRLQEIDSLRGTRGNRVFYLATPPRVAPAILQSLHAEGLLCDARDQPFARVIMEKPFGRDLQSAVELNRLVAEVVSESQVYRIDHYLGKETVQNILVFRFANAIFEPLWNHKYIDHIQITAAEEIGVEGRGAFYEETGALRDMVQSHLLQVLALTAMEAPVSFKADDIRDEKGKVFRALRQMSDADVERNTVQGQYEGYRSEDGVAADADTPTFVALKVFVDNWRWQGVPFYIRTGKRLATRATAVVIYFRRLELCLFEDNDVCQALEPNVLVIRIQPEEGIALRFVAKVPGFQMSAANVLMDFPYESTFGRKIPAAYERLLLDAMNGDQTLFARRDGVETSWRFVTPILDAWEAMTDRPAPLYAPGTWGPADADALLGTDGRAWHPL